MICYFIAPFKPAGERVEALESMVEMAADLGFFAQAAFEATQQVFFTASEQLFIMLGDFLPKLMLALIVFSIGFACAVLFRKCGTAILRMTGADLLAAKSGLRSFLLRGGMRREVSWIAGAALYWATLLSALILAFEILGLALASLLIKQAIFFIPQIAISLFLLSLGFFLGRFLGQLVEKASYLASLPGRRIFGAVAQYTVIGLSVVMALENLQVAQNTLLLLFLFLFAIVPLGICALLFVGGRDIIACLLAGYLVRRELEPGIHLAFDGEKGTLEAIGLVHTRIQTEEGVILVPNSRLVREKSTRLSKGPEVLPAGAVGIEIRVPRVGTPSV